METKDILQGLAICDECGHAAVHGKYGCEFERGDAWVTGNQADQPTVLMAQGPCGCAAKAKLEKATHGGGRPAMADNNLLSAEQLKEAMDGYDCGNTTRTTVLVRLNLLLTQAANTARLEEAKWLRFEVKEARKKSGRGD